MSILGLVVEYNPFHNGHLHHLQQSKLLSGADGVICVMSGNFIQRGEPAILNKWARAKMALLSGADLVIELPTVYAMASAEFFAYGAVKILDSLGIVDYICFGSESGELKGLNDIAQVLVTEPDNYREYLKKSLSRGLSFPAAREEAIKYYFKTDRGTEYDVVNLLSHSNNILGIEYIKAIYKLNSSIKPLTIQRIGNTYNQQELSESFSSATSIRKYINEKSVNGDQSDIQSLIPKSSQAILEEEIKAGRGPVFPEYYENIILTLLRKMRVENIRELPYVGEGLENRIKKASETSGSLDELIDKISTRRYTRTRIQRCLFSTITGLTKSMFDEFNTYGGPQYARVLGFNFRGRELLKLINEKATIPVITKTADYKNSCNKLLSSMLSIESAATDIYVLGYKNANTRRSGQEYTENVIII